MKKTKPALKKLLWKHFAQYIKLRYSDGYITQCYTCDRVLQLGTSNCQAGHWLPKGGYSALYFAEDNVRVQCMHCNVHLSGNTAVFERRLAEEIGRERVEEMYNQRSDCGKRSKEWYIEQIGIYKQKCKDIQSNLVV